MAANITKITAPYLADTIAPLRISPLYAGEAIPVCSPCFIHTDGKAYKCVSTEVDEANHTKFDGISIAGAAAANDPVTLFGLGARIHVCASGLTIGARYWVSATAGAIYDAKVASADTPIAKAVSATDIRIIRASY
jgi:hypothetical protein